MELGGFANDPRFDKPKQKQVNKVQNEYWNRLFAWLLPRDQAFSLHFVSHPSKLPGGVHPFTVHKYTPVAGGPTEEILCTESYEGVRRDGDGTLIKKPCFWCECYQTLSEHEDGHFLESVEAKDVSVHKTIEEFNPYNNRVYIMPALIKARIVVIGEGSNVKTEVYPDYNTVSSVTFWVKENDGVCKASPGGFIGKLNEFCKQYKQIDDPNNGCWFTIINQSQVGFQFGNLEAPMSLYQTVPNFEKLMQHYPTPRTWGQTQVKNKVNKIQSYNYSKNLMSNSWAGKVLASLGIDWDWFEETVVDNTPAQPQWQQPPQQQMWTPQPYSQQTPMYNQPQPHKMPWES